MNQAAVLGLTRDVLWPKLRAERDRLRSIDRWTRRPGTTEQLELPRGASREHKALRDLSDTPLLGTVVTTMAQGLFVDGLRQLVDRVLGDPPGVRRDDLLVERLLPIR